MSDQLQHEANVVTAAFVFCLLALGVMVVLLVAWLRSEPPPANTSKTDGINDDSVVARSYVDGQGPSDQIVSIIDGLGDDLSVQRVFKSVFALTPGGGEHLIGQYMDRHRCGRIEAMRLAITDRRRDNERS